MMLRPPTRRSALLACVLLAHGASLWALQHGLMQRVVDSVVPAQVLTEISLIDATPPLRAPATAPKPPSPLPPPALTAANRSATALPQPNTPRATLQPPVAPAPLEVAALAPMEMPLAASTTTAAHNPAVATSTAAATPWSAPNAQAATAAAPATVQLPSSDADYLNNPKPAYPALSRRLGEQGKVVVRTLIGADGVPQRAEVLRSSSFERLDRAAVETAMRWRYVAGKRAGVPEAMWFSLPLHFVLD
jgi:protein TonB